MTLGEAIKAHRARVGLSQPKLAQLSGVAESTLAALERPKTTKYRRVKGCNVNTIFYLADAMGITASELLDGVEGIR